MCIFRVSESPGTKLFLCTVSNQELDGGEGMGTKLLYNSLIFHTGVPAMRTALVIGGLPIANQLHRLRSGVQVCVYV